MESRSSGFRRRARAEGDGFARAGFGAVGSDEGRDFGDDKVSKGVDGDYGRLGVVGIAEVAVGRGEMCSGRMGRVVVDLVQSVRECVARENGSLEEDSDEKQDCEEPPRKAHLEKL